MKQSKNIMKLGELILTAIIIFQLNGCSMVGLGTGAIIGASKQKKIAIPEEVEILKPGTTVEIIQKDGESLIGKYCGTQTPTIEQYAETYTKIREQKPDGIILPELYDSIMVNLKSGQHLQGKFLGFTYDHNNGIYLRKREDGKFLDETIELDTIRNIEGSQGNVLETDTLNSLMLKGRIPLLITTIVIKNEAGYHRITMDKVNNINVKSTSPAASLFVFGLILYVLSIKIKSDPPRLIGF